MGTPNLPIKQCLRVAYEYLESRTDKASVALQRQLQSLAAITEPEIFEPTSQDSLELYLWLERFLTPAEARSILAGKVLTLFTHISEFPCVRTALRDEVKLVPVLSNFLVNSKLSRDNFLKTLTLLSHISFRLKVDHLEGWLLKVIPFLASTITEGSLTDESVLLALQVLAALCRSNPAAVQCLQRFNKTKEMLQKLSQAKNVTVFARLLTAEMYYFLIPDMSTADMMHERILNLTFTVAIEGLEENRVTWVQLASDIFEELTNLPYMDTSLKECRSYGANLEVLLSHSMPGNSELLTEALMEFVLHLVKLNHPDIREHHDAVFSKVVEWVWSPKCGVIVVTLVRELLAACGMTGLAKDTMDTLLNSVKSNLPLVEKLGLDQLKHVSVVLHLLEEIASASESLQLTCALNLESGVLSRVMRSVLALQSHHLASPNTTTDLKCNSSLDTINTISRSATALCHEASSSTNGNHEYLNSSQRVVLSQTVVTLLAVSRTLGTIRPDKKEEYRKMMGLPVVMSHLVWAIQSGQPEYVSKAWTFISDGGLSTECLNVLTVAMDELPSLATNNMNGSPQYQRLTGSERHKPSSAFPAEFEEKINTMIDNLGGKVRKMEFEEGPLTDLVNLYEFKISTMSCYEESLHDALNNACVQNRQSQRYFMQTRLQNDHLRNLLTKWESRFQKCAEEKLDLQKKLKEVEEDARQFKNNFINEKEKLERQTNDTNRELEAIKKAFEAKEEDILKLNQQLSNKYLELKSLHTRLQDEQHQKSELSAQVKEQIEELKLGRNHLKELKREKESSDNTVKKLEKENVDLEMLVKMKDETIAAKDEELEDKNKKLKELADMQNMIHNISSRRVVN